MAVYKQGLFTESVSSVTATPSVELGTRRVVNGQEYVYCYNGATVADKRLMVKPLTAGVDYTFSVTTVAGTIPCIGTVANATIAAASYGWILTKGYTKGVGGGTVTWAVGGALAPVRLIQGADGVVEIATGGTGSTGATVGFVTSAVSDITAASFGIYVSTGF